MSLHRRAAKRDSNEPAIVASLEEYRFLVGRVSMKGWPDLVALRFETTAWCEVKQPGESFTPEQVEMFRAMAANGVDVHVLETVEDVDSLAAGTLAPWTGEGITIRDAKKTHKGKRPHRPGYDRARTLAEMCWADGCATAANWPQSHYCAKHEGTT